MTITPPPGSPERIQYLTALVSLSMPQTAEVLGMSLSSVRRAIERGELRTVRIGHRVLVPAEAVRALLDPSAVT